MLLRLLKIYEFDLEKAKNLLLIFLKIRQKNSILFSNRDLLSEEFIQTSKYHQFFPMRRCTPENHKISIYRINESRSENLNICSFVRFIFAWLDAKFVTILPGDENELPHDGEIFVSDVKNYGIKELLQALASPFLVKMIAKYVQEAAPLKIVQLHFINGPTAFVKLMKFIKTFLNKDVADALIFHSSLESLYAKVPKEYLPIEFGGTAGKCDDLNREWVQIFMGKR